MILLHLDLDSLTGKKLVKAAEVSFKVAIAGYITYASWKKCPEDSSVQTS